MVETYLGPGSNIGNRELQFNETIKILHDYRGIQVIQVFHIYETEPVGYINQSKLLSLCIKIRTKLNPQPLLKCCSTAEQQLHHKKEIRWEPRTLDIDILSFGDQVIEQGSLSVPHPRMKEYSFVLIPPSDIATKQIEPISNRNIGQLVMPDNSIKKYKE